MIFPTLKAALGYYEARRRGPEMRGPKYEPRVQASHSESEAAHWTIAAELAKLDENERGRVLAWATAPDEAVSAPRSALRSLYRALRDLGVIEPPARPVASERVSFVDLNSGEVVTLRRLTGCRGCDRGEVCKC